MSIIHIFVTLVLLLSVCSLAPMLATLGYDPDAYPPHYGDPDEEVVRQSNTIVQSTNQTDAFLQKNQ